MYLFVCCHYGQSEGYLEEDTAQRWGNKKTVARIAILIIFFFVLFSSGVHAGNSGIRRIVWMTPVWEGLTDENGIYTIIVKEISRRSGVKLEILERPLKRALLEVASGKGDLTGGVPEPVPGTLALRLPVFQTKISLLTKSKIVDLTEDSNSIYRLKISTTHRVLDSAGLNPSRFAYDIFEVQSRKQAFLMFVHDRVEGYVDADFEMVRTAGQEEIDLGRFVKQPIKNAQVFMVVSKSDRGRRIKQLFDKVLAELYREKFIESLYLEKGFIPPVADGM